MAVRQNVGRQLELEREDQPDSEADEDLFAAEHAGPRVGVETPQNKVDGF